MWAQQLLSTANHSSSKDSKKEIDHIDAEVVKHHENTSVGELPSSVLLEPLNPCTTTKTDSNIFSTQLGLPTQIGCSGLTVELPSYFSPLMMSNVCMSTPNCLSAPSSVSSSNGAVSLTKSMVLAGTKKRRSVRIAAVFPHAVREGTAPTLEGMGITKCQEEGVSPTGCQVEGADQAGCHVEGIHQAGCQIEGVDQAGCQVEGIHQAGCQVEGADQAGCQVEGIHQAGCQVEGADQAGCQVEGIHQAGCQVESIDQAGCQVEGIHQAGCQVEGIHQAGCQVESIDQAGCQVEGIHQAGCQVEGADQAGCQVEGADQAGCQVEGADQAGCQVEGIDQAGCQVEGADQAGCQVEGVDQVGCQVECVDQAGCQVEGVDQAGCQVEGVDQVGCQVEGTDQAGCQVESIDPEPARCDESMGYQEGPVSFGAPEDLMSGHAELLSSRSKGDMSVDSLLSSEASQESKTESSVCLSTVPDGSLEAHSSCESCQYAGCCTLPPLQLSQSGIQERESGEDEDERSGPFGVCQQGHLDDVRSASPEEHTSVELESGTSGTSQSNRDLTPELSASPLPVGPELSCDVMLPSKSSHASQLSSPVEKDHPLPLLGVDDRRPLLSVQPVSCDSVLFSASGEPNQVPSGELNQVPFGEPNQVPSGELNQVPSGELNQVPSGELNQVPSGELNQVPSGELNQVPSGELNQVPSGELNQVPSGELNQVPSGELNQVPSGELKQVPSGELNQVPSLHMLPTVESGSYSHLPKERCVPLSLCPPPEVKGSCGDRVTEGVAINELKRSVLKLQVCLYNPLSRGLCIEKCGGGFAAPSTPEKNEGLWVTFT